MKYLITICLFNILSELGWSAELVPFKAPQTQKSGAGRPFELSKGVRSVLKTPRGAFLVLELIEAHKDGSEKTSPEFCSIAWTYIDGDGTASGTEKWAIQYSSNADENGDVKATYIGGLVSIRGVNMNWLYSTQDMVLIIPRDNARYSLTKVEQPGPAQPATQPADKPHVKVQFPTPTSKDAPR